MVVTQVHVIRGDRSDILEEFLGQPLAENEQVYLIVYATDSAEEAVSPAAEKQRGDWSAAQNERRGELIDKYIQDSITRKEQIELDLLQRQFHEFQERNWPLPIEKARELHRELLEKKTSAMD